MIKTWRHKELESLFRTGKSAKIKADLVKRALRRLDVLNVALRPEDMRVPGFNFHALLGKPQRYTVHVNGPWTITFGWDDTDAIDVDLEQYH